MFFRLPRTIFSASVYNSTFCSISKSIFDYAFQVLLYFFIIYWCYDFDAIVQITGHQICRTDVITFLTIVGENKDTRMFQITVYDSVNLDIFTYSRYSGDK